jgi:Glycosyl transferase family 2
MTELLEAVAAAVADEGVEVSLEADRYPPFRDGVAYVLIPHEFFDSAPRGGEPTPGHLRRTVGFCVELPGTPWFWETWRHAPRLGALVDIRESSARKFRMAGIPCTHAPLGYSPAWDRWDRDEFSPRPIDVLYMGSAEPRRERVLAGYAETLAGKATRLLIPPEAPKPHASPSFLLGEDKHDLLRSSKTLLNLHRTDADALEWPRVLEAICNGCVVITERSIDMAPLVPGEHLIAARAESLGFLAERLLDDPDRLQRTRLSAYDFVRRELPMSTGARRLIEVAERLVSRRLRPGAVEQAPGEPVDEADGTPDVVEDAVAPLRRAVKRALLETQEVRRELGRLLDEGENGPREARVETVTTTPAYGRAEPRVTVGISLHNYEAEVSDALRSLTTSEYEDFEVLVLDDASTDGSAAAVLRFLDAHPWLPAALLQHSTNAGLPRTRNAITERARGELVFVLDADNGIYPHALARLVAALDADPDAAFAYPIIAARENGRPAGLLSRHGWDPGLLAEDNTIDAMALIRREVLLELGGYCTDPRLIGWEDYDLWCQIAERGWRGVHVPELLAWYRRTGHSMLSITGLDVSEARSLLSTRSPGVFRGAAPTGTRPRPS